MELKADEVPVSDVAFSPNGGLLASAKSDGSIELWDFGAGKIVDRLVGHVGIVNTVAFSPDGSRLISGGDDATAIVWDMGTRKRTATLSGHRRWVDSAKLSGGELAATAGGDGTARVWNLKTGQVSILKHDDEVREVAFLRNAQLLATGSRDKTIRIWEIGTWRLCDTINGYGGHRAIGIAPDGKTLAAGMWDYQIKLWQIDKPSETQVLHVDDVSRGLSGGEGVKCVAFFDAGRGLVGLSGGSSKVLFWNLSAAGANPELPIDINVPCSCIAVSSRDVLAVGEVDRGLVHLWQLPQRKKLGTLRTPSQSASQTVAFAPNGLKLAAGCMDGSIVGWDIQDAEESRRLFFQAQAHALSVTCLAFTRGGEVIGSTSRDATVKIWDFETGRLKRDMGKRRDWIHTIAFSPDSSIMAVGGYECVIELFQVESGNHLGVLRGHAYMVNALAFADKRTLFSAGADRVVKIWDVEDRQELFTLGTHESALNCLALSPDSKMVAAGGRYGGIRLWRAASEEEVRVAGW